MELFMYNDPRLLAGCVGKIEDSVGGYERHPTCNAGKAVTTETLEAYRMNPEETPRELAARAGIKIHEGKSGYHNTPVYNNFFVEGQWPTAGVELETVTSCPPRDEQEMVKDLWSNWWHFEHDGSLPSNGYELITEPLPPRVYRDPRTWIGLENAISPWLESFDHPETGLHIHVGLNQFESIDQIPVRGKLSRVCIGKYMSLMVYYVLAGSTLVDRVALRSNTSYCGATANAALLGEAGALQSGKMTGAEFVDLITGILIKSHPREWRHAVTQATTATATVDTSGAPYCDYVLTDTSEHRTEVNCGHRYTIEFRRGKGTCHSLSIHRMVELMTGIVRYAGKCAREPNEIVSRNAFLDFIDRTTTSEVLRKLIRKG